MNIGYCLAKYLYYISIKFAIYFLSKFLLYLCRDDKAWKMSSLILNS